MAPRSALAHATGDIIIIHDADLAYNPADIPALLIPFVKEGVDAVFGSRYLSAPYRRALMYRHTLINKMLTVLSNWLTDLTLTDIETCYKAVNATSRCGPGPKGYSLRGTGRIIDVDKVWALSAYVILPSKCCVDLQSLPGGRLP
jgi:hypothetical protein